MALPNIDHDDQEDQDDQLWFNRFFGELNTDGDLGGNNGYALGEDGEDVVEDGFDSD